MRMISGCPLPRTLIAALTLTLLMALPQAPLWAQAAKPISAAPAAAVTPPAVPPAAPAWDPGAPPAAAEAPPDMPAAAAAAAPAPAEAAAPAPAAPPAPPPTAPFLVKFDQISGGDTAWMLTSTALVLLMTVPGLILFYGGMVRKKNVLATMMQGFAVTCLVTVLWTIIGYSIAFMPGSTGYYGGLDRLLLSGMSYMKEDGMVSVHHAATTIPESVYMMFQMTFAIITPALIAGAFAERMKFSAMLIYMGLWSVLVYSPIAHWMWEPSGWLASRGMLDFAGGTVVHLNAGIAGLVCAYMLKPRQGYGEEPMMPHNLTLTITGASLLWVGWFGFNAGSAVAADGRAGMAMAVTQIATATAALTWIFVEWLIKGRPTVLGISSGAVAGLVAITPASGFVDPVGALIIGVAAGIFCYWGATSLKRLLGSDDSLDVFGIHGIGGSVGAVLTGVLVSKEISGVTGDVLVQLTGVGATFVYSGGMSLIILKILDLTLGLRVTPAEEAAGLDLSLHGEQVE